MFRFWVSRDCEIWSYFWPQGAIVANLIKLAIYVIVPFGTGGVLTGDITSLWKHPDSWPFYALPFVIIVGSFWGWSAVKLQFDECQKINEQEEKLKPKFKLNLHFTGHEVKDAQDRVGYKYVNVCVEPLSEANIENCTAHLVSLLKNGHKTEFENSIPLQWSYPREAIKKTIVAGTEGTAHVASSASHGHGLGLEGIQWTRLKDTFRDPAIYRFKVVVNGSGVSQSIEIDVKWTGQWDEIEAYEVKNG